MGNHKTTIKINGNKLRSLLETATGKTIYQIAEESGYSRNVIANAVRQGYASSAVQNIARLYGITPDEYKVKDPEPKKEPAQISIDDLESIKKDDLKAIIKEAVKEAIDELLYNSEFALIQSPIDKTIRLLSRRIKEDKKCKRQ
jgi:hypothetical protein